MTVARTTYRTDFNVVVGDRALRPTLPQRIGRVLWAPMLAMALAAFPLAFALALARAALIVQGDKAAMVAALGHYVPAAMFLGFASVFAAISFAIARILGVLRTGGGSIQMMAIALEAMRRLGAATYLVSIALGLATIFKVLGFQAIRIRELALEPRRIP